MNDIFHGQENESECVLSDKCLKAHAQELLLLSRLNQCWVMKKMLWLSHFTIRLLALRIAKAVKHGICCSSPCISHVDSENIPHKRLALHHDNIRPFPKQLERQLDYSDQKLPVFSPIIPPLASRTSSHQDSIHQAQPHERPLCEGM